MGKMIIALVIGVIILTATFSLIGSLQWKSASNGIHEKLEANRISFDGQKQYTSDKLIGLPEPTQRYFRKVLTEGQSMVRTVRAEHNGTFNMSENGENWKPFSSEQLVVVDHPGFLWNARIRVAPGLRIFVHDAFVAGRGVLTAKLFGIFTVMHQPNTPDLARGELMRFFAEAAWYPTALLPGKNVQWEAVNDSSARATLSDGNYTLTLLFCFGEDGLMESVRAEDRMRLDGNKNIPTPWEGRWSRYEKRDGMLIPLEGEVAWILPEGRKPYWRGKIAKISYDFSD